MPAVLIVCFESYNTISEIPHLLKRSGCIVDVFCSSSSWLVKNRYFNNWFEWKSEGTFCEELKQTVKTGAYDWVILGDDQVIKRVILSNDKELREKVIPLTNMENGYMLSSKKGLSLFCEKYQITTPKFVVLETTFQLQNIDKILSFPVLAKVDFSVGGYGTYLCKGVGELQCAMSELPEHEKKDLLIQEFIDGKEIMVEAFFWQGELISYNTAYVLDRGQGNFSYSTRKKYFKYTAVEDDLVKLAECAGFHGVANMSYIYDEIAGRHYLIEADLRPNSWMNYGGFVGNDFADGIKSVMKFNEKNARPKCTQKTKEVVLFYKDVLRCIHKSHKLGFVRWLVNYHNCWRFIPFNDRRLLYYSLRTLAVQSKLAIDRWFTRKKTAFSSLFKSQHKQIAG